VYCEVDVHQQLAALQGHEKADSDIEHQEPEYFPTKADMVALSDTVRRDFV
jgi:hypothetical protein